MVFWFWKRKKLEKEVERLKEIMMNSFGNVKNDLKNVSLWISHLNEKNKIYDGKFANIENKIEELQNELDEIKEMILLQSRGVFKQVFKQLSKHQTGVEGVQTAVQTGVQTAKSAKKAKELRNFLFQDLTLMERSIVWVLLNTDMKLSCEDIAAVLGKSESTIRGQMNSLKVKLPNLVSEIIEKNGKKRYYIESKIKEMILRGIKVKLKQKPKSKSES
jgi:DNA-binding CsgD family transcriptional regulator